MFGWDSAGQIILVLCNPRQIADCQAGRLVTEFTALRWWI